MDDGRRHPAIIATAQSTYPVTATEAKLYCGIEGTADDDMITRMIKGSTKYFQQLTGHQTTQATFDQFWDGFPEEIQADWGPVASVSFLKYYDVDDTLTTMSSSTEYQTSLNSRPARVIPAYGTVWPTTRAGKPESVNLRYVAGYASVASIEEGVLVAIMELVKHWYANRGPVLTEGAVPQNVPHTLNDLIKTYRLYGYR